MLYKFCNCTIFRFVPHFMGSQSPAFLIVIRAYFLVQHHLYITHLYLLQNECASSDYRWPVVSRHVGTVDLGNLFPRCLLPPYGRSTRPSLWDPERLRAWVCVVPTQERTITVFHRRSSPPAPMLQGRRGEEGSIRWYDSREAHGDSNFG